MAHPDAYLESLGRPLTSDETDRVLKMRRELKNQSLEAAYAERKNGAAKEAFSPAFPPKHEATAEPEPQPEPEVSVEPPATTLGDCPKCGRSYVKRRMCYQCNGEKIKGGRAARSLRFDPAPKVEPSKVGRPRKHPEPAAPTHPDADPIPEPEFEPAPEPQPQAGFRPLRLGDASIQALIDDHYQIAAALSLAKDMSPRALDLFRAELAELSTP